MVFNSMTRGDAPGYDEYGRWPKCVSTRALTVHSGFDIDALGDSSSLAFPTETWFYEK
jgi:hypothetical protein